MCTRVRVDHQIYYTCVITPRSLLDYIQVHICTMYLVLCTSYLVPGTCTMYYVHESLHATYLVQVRGMYICTCTSYLVPRTNIVVYMITCVCLYFWHWLTSRKGTARVLQSHHRARRFSNLESSHRSSFLALCIIVEWRQLPHIP